jgi:aerobic-type carbon monoxide dehydrogenase small subunit (CoxS/CutS family)
MLTFIVNGAPQTVEVAPLARLSDVLREKTGLYGVRVSCAEGECGSCTVLVDGEPVTSCLMLARQAEGCRIETIEGVGTPERLHPIQRAFIEEQAFQCAFCTAGFILAAKAFLAANPNPSEAEATEAMSGNICRCGSYPYIVKAVLKAAELLRGEKETFG